MQKFENPENLTRESWEALKYPVQIQALTEEEGGGWIAWIPLLGQGAFMFDGDTVEETLAGLERLRRGNYDLVVKAGRPIPLPGEVVEPEERPSGKWVQRVTPDLHAELQKGAKRAGVSFNTYCLGCLQRGQDANASESAVREALQEVKTELVAAVRALMENSGVPLETSVETPAAQSKSVSSTVPAARRRARQTHRAPATQPKAHAA